MPIGLRAGIPRPTISEQMDSIAFRHAEGMMIQAAQTALAGPTQADYASTVQQQMAVQSGIPLRCVQTLTAEPPQAPAGLGASLVAGMRRI